MLRNIQKIGYLVVNYLQLNNFNVHTRTKVLDI